MRRKIDRKKQIREVATKLFSKCGYDKVTIKEISTEVGITEPALYRHFKSKASIYEAALVSIESQVDFEDLFEELQNSEDLQYILTSLAEHIIKFFNANEDLYRLLLYSTLKGHSRANEVYKIVRGSYIEFLAKQFDRLFAIGKIIEKKNDIIARCFIGMVFDCSLGTTLWKNFQIKNYTPEEIIANNIPIYIRGLSVNE
ncbi:MAG: TetR/AcrR family transcriptional regulator [candidate division Zixibacteria bacterium]|nr:TetR/AcrR family transcriptional regulator [candidate division Zixibacteria bacterium]